MEKVTLDQESPFEFGELFFSKTDKGGIIQSGNSVFQRVSEYSWEEVLKKPHNLIRHPDMPRAVFYLLWDFLKNGKPIGAFVKNRSKQGKYYWVFALAMPIKDGYLSVRLKPSGDLLNTISQEYQKLRSLERSQKLQPEESAKLLLQRIKELGFENYSQFMAEALVNQIANRHNKMGVASSREIAIMMELKKLGVEIARSTRDILSAYNESKLVPLNLEIFSASRGKEGAQVSVVASQYQKMAKEIREEIERFRLMSDEVIEKINASQFYIGSAELMNEVAHFIEKEATEKDDSQLKELRDLAKFYVQNAITSVYQISTVITNFVQICDTLRTMGLGLELVRITGKIELSNLPQSNDAGALLESLRNFQSNLKTGLTEIQEHNSGINERTRALLARL